MLVDMKYLLFISAILITLVGCADNQTSDCLITACELDNQDIILCQNLSDSFCKDGILPSNFKQWGSACADNDIQLYNLVCQ